jgi:hypothetical protein
MNQQSSKPLSSLVLSNQRFAALVDIALVRSLEGGGAKRGTGFFSAGKNPGKVYFFSQEKQRYPANFLACGAVEKKLGTRC